MRKVERTWEVRVAETLHKSSHISCDLLRKVGRPLRSLCNQQNDLANATLFCKHLGLGCVLQGQMVRDGESEFSVVYIIGELAHLGWIGLRQDALDLQFRMRLGDSSKKKGGVSEVAPWLDLMSLFSLK